MIQTSRIFTLCLSILVLTAAGFAQDRGDRQKRPEGNRPQENRQKMSVEEWKKQQTENINNKTKAFMKKMGDVVPEDKMPAVTTLVQQHLVGQLKIQMVMMGARQKAEGDRDAMRQLMTKNQEQLKELTAKTGDAAKEVLDKKALRTFKKNLDDLSPQRSGSSGQSSGGRGSRGGGGGGGGGGR